MTRLWEKAAEEMFTLIPKGTWSCRCGVCSDQRDSAAGFMTVTHPVLVNFIRKSLMFYKSFLDLVLFG